MDVHIRTVDEAAVVALAGEIDASSAAAAQQQILPLAGPGARLVLDMSGVTFMSSAGLRMLLSTYRQISANQGRVVLVGLSEELSDTMAMTGFLVFFTTQATVEAGLQALKA
jgi:anti-sigma B factor antagonist